MAALVIAAKTSPRGESEPTGNTFTGLSLLVLVSSSGIIVFMVTKFMGVAWFRGWGEAMQGVERTRKYVLIITIILQTPVVRGLAVTTCQRRISSLEARLRRLVRGWHDIAGTYSGGTIYNAGATYIAGAACVAGTYIALRPGRWLSSSRSGLCNPSRLWYADSRDGVFIMPRSNGVGPRALLVPSEAGPLIELLRPGWSGSCCWAPLRVPPRPGRSSSPPPRVGRELVVMVTKSCPTCAY